MGRIWRHFLVIFNKSGIININTTNKGDSWSIQWIEWYREILSFINISNRIDVDRIPSTTSPKPVFPLKHDNNSSDSFVLLSWLSNKYW